MRALTASKRSASASRKITDEKARRRNACSICSASPQTSESKPVRPASNTPTTVQSREAKRIVETLRRERDEARVELKKTEDDFQSVFDSRDEVIRERERARQACNTYWHDLTRIALLCAQTDDEYPLKAVERTVRERDEARAEVERLRGALAQAQRADE